MILRHLVLLLFVVLAGCSESVSTALEPEIPSARLNYNV